MAWDGYRTRPDLAVEHNSSQEIKIYEKSIHHSSNRMKVLRPF